jgi:hypothetical protein
MSVGGMAQIIFCRMLFNMRFHQSRVISVTTPAILRPAQILVKVVASQCHPTDSRRRSVSSAYSLVDDSSLNSSLQQNVAQSGQAGNPGASLQFGGQPEPPATMACPNHHWPPEVLAKADARGIPAPLWQLFDVAVHHECGGDLRVIVHFKKNTQFS